MRKDSKYNNPLKQKKLMIFGQEARDKLLEGVEIMYKAVCSTLSPKGRNVSINRNWGAPIIIHDGVGVAQEVKDPDKFVQMGINLIKEAASKTGDLAGDGTTTSTLIARELIRGGFELIDRGTNPMVLRDQILEAEKQALSHLKELSRPVKSREDFERVAYISSADKEIGRLVGKAVDDAGETGLVSVEESGSYDTYVDQTVGMSIDKGYITPYFVTNPRQMEAVVDSPYIVITDRSITTQAEIVPIIDELVKKWSKDIVVIGTVTGHALKILVTNKVEGTINCLAVKPPAYGAHVKGFLEDIAILTGGRVISEEFGYTATDLIEKIDEGWFGRADKVIADRNNTLIVGGRGNPKEVEKQIENLKKQHKEATNDPEKEKLLERIAKLSTGVSVVRVGARTDVEGREKVERVKDAVGSAQSAREEGVVIGGGITFLHLADKITLDTEGAKLMKKALGAVLNKILENCGKEGDLAYSIINEIKTAENKNMGYEVVSDKVVDLDKEGIIDPAKVIRLCVENATSVATSILTTDTLIDYPEYLDSVK